MKENSRVTPERKWSLIQILTGFIIGAILTSVFLLSGDKTLLCTPFSSSSFSTTTTTAIAAAATTTSTPPPPPTSQTSLTTIIHYATSKIIPQQSIREISVSFNVLRTHMPCNFLVYGLGYDSQMWAALNPNGNTLFLEEDPKWVKSVLKDAPHLKAEAVKYRTQLRDADRLLKTYRDVRDCRVERGLKGNKGCELALEALPEEVYAKEWDLIMIDAPRGWFPSAPGRMAAIYSAAVMARTKTKVGGGTTHVFVHDVNRKVEKQFAMEFLCKRYLLEEVGRLWHFEIPAGARGSEEDGRFC